MPWSLKKKLNYSCFRLFVRYDIDEIQGGPKKPPYFVFDLEFLFLNIFSKNFHKIVAEYQEIFPYQSQVYTKKSLSAVVIEKSVKEMYLISSKCQLTALNLCVALSRSQFKSDFLQIW